MHFFKDASKKVKARVLERGFNLVKAGELWTLL